MFQYDVSVTSLSVGNHSGTAAVNEKGDAGDSDDTAPQSTEKIWNRSAKELVDKTEEEEFDDYFKDMLL